MKELPILFSTPMVQAVLANRKSQTRRLTNLKTVNAKPEQWTFIRFENNPEIIVRSLKKDSIKQLYGYYAIFEIEETQVSAFCKCPYGAPGTWLWVRETWASSKALDKTKPSNILSGFGCEYKAGGSSLTDFDELCDRGRWRPSIHMPKHASRIWAENTEVKIERLQDISEEDCIAEGIKGVKHWKTEKEVFEDYMYYTNYPMSENRCVDTAKQSFETLWYSINGNLSWITNPWVWAISFKELSRTGKPEYL